MMEEETTTPMETDVSSTTQDMPAAQDGQASSSTMEVTVVVAETTVEVEEIKEEDQDRSIDSNTPETNTSKVDSLAKTTIVSPPPPKLDISPEKPPLKTTPETAYVIVDEASSSVSNVENYKSPLKESLTTSSDNIQPNATIETDKSLENTQSDTCPTKASCDKLDSSHEHIISIVISNKLPVPIPENEKTNSDKDDESYDSQTTIGTTTTEASEKEHKSISRELRSLINSAKESKIISECTQLTSKTRKSRTQNDSLNSTLNTSVDGKKIQARRSSDNSQVSNSSELDTSQDSKKRSMRSQNPDFASKQKQFISSITARLQKDDSTPAGSDDEITKIKVDSPAKKKLAALAEPSNEKSKKLHIDPYCWRCHYLIEDVANEKKHPPTVCSICPREYHFKCLSGAEKTLLETEKKWVCPECLNILVAEGSETRSPAMRKTNLAMLCELLKYALSRMMEANGVEPFINPVDRTVFPDYDKYVVHPMDLTLIKENIGKGHYGSTEAFIADVSWILHNSIIFNTLQSKLTAVARTLLRSAKQEMSEIEACPECYSAANARRPTWFTDVCSTPHILLWAKLKGFPYWPAKGMSVNSSGMVDVRFFGAHDRAWVYPKDCFLYSEKDPNNFRTKRQDILDSMQEAEQHIRNISRKFGKFIYPEFKVAFDPSKMSEQLKAMIPGYVEEFPRNVVINDKPSVSTPPPGVLSKRRSNSKCSKDHDGETSDTEDSSTASKKKALDTSETSKEDKSSESDKAPPEQKTVTKPSDGLSRKRRRSVLEEATTMTIMEAPSEKKKRVDSSETDNASSPSILKKAQDNKSTDSDSPKTPKPSKEDKPRTPKPKRHSTPKIVLKTVPVQKKTPQPVEKPSLLRRDKSSSSDKDKCEEKNKSTIKPKSKSNTPQRTVDPKTDKIIGKSTPIESAAKENDSSNSNSSRSTPNRTPMPRSVKDKIVFDDDTTLAVLAKKCSKPVTASPKGSMITITNVCSLSQPSTSTSKSPGNKASTPKLRTIAPAPAASVASSQLGKKQVEQIKTIVGTVGVRSFARMKSPPPPPQETPKSVEIEVKAEPMDYEDAERQNQKIEMLNAFCLRPVNSPSASSLRQVRVTKANQVIVEKHPEKTAEPRPKAKKSFPQPRKPEETRSELNGKNSMVYIPIQPPMTQAPNRAPIKVNGPVPSGPPALRHSSANPNNASPSLAPNTVPAPPSLTQSPSAPSSGTAAASAARPANVQTVPMITSLNGQWTFSLQPLLAVGGENPNPPLVNGVPQTGPVVPTVTTGPATAPPMLGLPSTDPPRLLSSPTASGNVLQDTSAPGEPPRLLQKPLQANPFDPKTAEAVVVPSEAGPISAKLNQHATKLAVYFRTLLEDSMEKLNNPVALVTVLKGEIEKLKWTHKQQITELQHNHELQMSEMRTSFMKEKTRAIAECSKLCATELEAAVKSAKCKQWCANCKKEAQFYCCWNTSYCDYSCQRAHWAHHHAHCTQQRASGNTQDCGDGKTPSTEDRLQPPDLPKVTSSNTMTVVGKVIPPRVMKNNPIRVTAAHRATTAVRHQGKPLIVSMMNEPGGTKCIGPFKPNTSTAQNQFILNKQIKSNEEAAKKMVTSGGYLIIGGDNSPSTNTSIVIN